MGCIAKHNTTNPKSMLDPIINTYAYDLTTHTSKEKKKTLTFRKRQENTHRKRQRKQTDEEKRRQN